MANLLSSQILSDIAAKMGDLEDTFANHVIVLYKANKISDKFDDEDIRSVGISLRCLISPRTNVDESNSIYFDDVGVAPKQQLTVYIFRREAYAKNIYDSNNNLLIDPTDQIVYNDDTYYITQRSQVGFFQEAGELIKIRLNKKID